jgi:hypothetical protein
MRSQAECLANADLTCVGCSVHMLPSRETDGRWTGLRPRFRFKSYDINRWRCQYFLSVLTPALRRARHFALAEDVTIQPKARS